MIRFKELASKSFKNFPVNKKAQMQESHRVASASIHMEVQPKLFETF